MRKTTSFLLFLCFQLTAWAQTNYRYWFDSDETSMQEGISNVNEWQMDIDVNGLTENIHQFHLQVADKNGTWSTILSRWFVKAPLQASYGMYWFDDNEMDMHRSDVLDGRFDIDVSMLTDGVHILTYQVRDTKDQPSAQYRTIFLKTPTPAKSKVHFWVDDDDEKMQTFAYDGNSHILDLTGVSDGFHILHIQAEDASPSSPLTKLFIKIPQTEGVEKLLCLCSIDGDIVKQEEVANHDGVLNWSLDVSDITQGFHHITVQVITNSGAGSSLYEGFFLRDFTTAEMASLKCVYSIDGEPHRTMAGSRGGDVFHFDLDVADIKDGLHNITYMLVGDNGVCTKSNSAFFWKTPIGGNGVIQYNYWLNDQPEKHEVVLKERANPFNLITLLPVDKMPVRSSCFDFKIENGTPVLYAKNDIHFEFIDASGFVNVANAQYVDMSESLKVTDISSLKSTQTFSRPEENGIRWFKFEAAPGDTVAFKSNQATSLQVFAQSGVEILSIMGDKSVQYSGAHTWEDGTYYVAVHDVTGTKNDITLDYMHMDKYDVVSQDVRVVGNGGCSTITYQGNGFRDLYAVDLKDSKGNIIKSIDVGHESDATTTVTFDFSDSDLGRYDAEFHFTGEDKRFANNITVEEAKDIDLKMKVDYSTTFLRGTASTYLITVTNQGNATAYFVPIQVNIKADCLDDISSIKTMTDAQFEKSFLIALESDSLDEATIEILKEYEANLNGTESFFIMHDTLEGEYFWNEYLIDIPPMSSVSINLSIASTSTINCRAVIPSEWMTLSSDWSSSSYAQAIKRNNIGDVICCHKEQINCVLNIVDQAAGIFAGPAAPVASCITSLTKNITSLTLDVGCGEGKDIKDKLKNNLKKDNIGKAIFETAISCLTRYYDSLIKPIADKIKNLKLQKDIATRYWNIAIKQKAEKMALRQECLAKAEAARNQGNIIEANSHLQKAKEYDEDVQYWENEIQKRSGEISDASHNISEAEFQLMDFENAYKMALHAIDDLLGIKDAYDCIKSIFVNKPKCPPNPVAEGGSSTPVNSYDPNDIYGYIAPTGSMYVGNEVVNLPYRIEFENDTTFATSSAHTVVVRDTLDAKVFDLSSYKPTSIKVGDKNVQLKGDKTFVTTVDKRPEINAIAQVEGLYDEKKGVATWRFTSLDPMTMEPTDDIMQGFLPVNYDGRGIGEVAYNINRKASLADGTEISNKASIIFDNNDAIETPVWTNIVDAVPPVTRVSEVEQVNDSIVRVHFDGEDNRSGVWKYALYVQYGDETSWFQVAETDTTCADFRFYEGIDYGLCVVATDSAGNVEKKIIQREYKFLNGEGEIVDGISSPRHNQIATNKAYDLSGRLIQEERYRGIIIKNNKKMFKR